MSASKKTPARKGHKPTTRDLVGVRGSNKLEDLMPSKRRARLSKLYGYKV